MSLSKDWSALLGTLESTPSRTVTFRPAPDSSAVQRAEAATGVLWPAQLREFYSLHGGQDPQDRGQLLPLSELFSLDRMLDEHRTMVELGQQMHDHDPDYFSHEGATGPAGTEAGVFLPTYIPIGGEDGWLFFCDTRAGEHHGCIRQWDKYDADSSGPSWDSLTDMLTAVRTSITGNCALIEFPGSAGWWPHSYDGDLIWSPGGPGEAEDSQGHPGPPEQAPGPEPTPLQIPFPLIDFRPSEVGPDDDIADLAAIEQRVLQTARALHPHAHIDGGSCVYPRLPRRQGINANFFLSVDGEQKIYLVVLTGEGNEVLIYEHPPQGFTTAPTN